MSVRATHRETGHFLSEVQPEMYEIIIDRRRATEPVATVIVPTRQRAGLVGDTIEAIFAQDIGRAFEVIVIDNASDDNTCEVMRQLAERAPCDFLAIRMHRDQGPAISRNTALKHARGWCVAFTDSDCIPSRGWLRASVDALEGGHEVVQGRTEAPPWQHQPLFSHFIETTREDGSFSTSNVAYQRDVVLAAGGFDARCDYWEDVDLGWRTLGANARAVFVDDALVYHQVIGQSPADWLMHAKKFGNWPEKAAAYPGFRRHLFLGVWIDWFHALISLSLLGFAASFVDRRLAMLAIPYAIAFPFRHGLRGRLPLLKAVAHLSRDIIAFTALLVGSIRHRSVVL